MKSGLFSFRVKGVMEKHHFDELVEIMERLRGPDGCLWDKEQTHHTLKQYLIEEAHEVIEAIDKNDPTHLKEELGDLLLQVVFHAQIAAEEKKFTIDDVIEGIVDKLTRRHPHVFGDVKVTSSQEILERWKRIKMEEKKTKNEKRKT